jgi:AAA+ ATPase superfamily predicted ATPase
MAVRFVDRREELELLDELCSEGRAQLVIVYGRRRVGKTRLLLELLRRRRGLYFYVPRGGSETILEELSRSVESEFFRGFRFASFHAFLEYVAARMEQGYVVVVDEFQRLAEVEGALSLLQRYWDEKYAHAGSTLILSGSAIGTIVRVALRGDAPLYGRRTAVLKLEPLGFAGVLEWFEKLSPLDAVKLYGIFGGTPAYLELIDESASPEENAVKLVLSKRGPLYEEPVYLLMEELRVPSRYMDILGAIAQGRTTLSEIASAAGLRRENATTYLSYLELLGIVEREKPLLGRGRARYSVRDPFFSFWFRFVWPNMRSLEAGLEREVWSSALEGFSTYLGWVFERIAREFVVQAAKLGELPVRPEAVGSWWSGGEEIDIVALSPREGAAMFFEVKWSDLSLREAKSLLARLAQKAAELEVGERICGIIARSLEAKNELRKNGYVVYDLSDVCSLLKRQ